MIDYTPWNVTDYHKIFIAEAKQLIEIFRNEIVEIHHVGSTAVQDMPGNQSMDILPVVKNIDKIDQYSEAMTLAGYRAAELSICADERCKSFTREIDNLTRVIIMVEKTNYEVVDRRLAVRDYLRVHADIRTAYALKEKLAFQYSDDSPDYHTARNEYVSSLERDAISWYQSMKR
ncbi:GrpB family protein [Macrococcus equipercicus]|uniref:GrpB family protein n=1 Tax=Macrococcus equipercicus TaxID=69967 RepID=A0A9Q9BLK9_9STAP|nr:GrpB family protein [Macrococcus equipercicus]KAA1037703.1 GrpB family protein [Macrococcus equipercicus]UTH13415.1 GrpB family protein [Macrococcus equipercicus]